MGALLWTGGSLLLSLAAAGLLLLAAYLLLLTVAAVAARRQAPPPAGPGRRRFAILIPAHNEELLLGRLLHSLHALDYPVEARDFCVVADNCDDATAQVARSMGGRVFERFDASARSKGHALRWLLERLRSAGERYDAYVVLDAGSVVGPGFLRAMDARLESGSQVIQAYYSVLNAADSPVAALRTAALAAVHFVRPLGRGLLGLSCGLKGNGMCFAAPVLERFDWRWFSLAEDVEFHLTLVERGLRVDFAPEAIVLADMPVTLAQAESQNARWERGRLQLARAHVPRLLAGGLRQLGRGHRVGLLSIDAAAEQLIPPLSVPLVLGTLCLAGALVLGAPLAAFLAALGIAGQAAHLLVGMRLAGAPAAAYLALLYAPPYVAWKVALYARALVAGPAAPWVRTVRLAGRD